MTPSSYYILCGAYALWSVSPKANALWSLFWGLTPTTNDLLEFSVGQVPWYATVLLYRQHKMEDRGHVLVYIDHHSFWKADAWFP